MKGTLSLILLFFSLHVFGQENVKIDSLNYAGIKIPVPADCSAKSEYELLDCLGVSIQWLYLREDMLSTVPPQIIGQFESQRDTRKKTAVSATSFGSKLDGYKFKMKSGSGDNYRLILYGVVNGQPLLLNIGMANDPKKKEDLDGVLSKIIELN